MMTHLTPSSCTLSPEGRITPEDAVSIHRAHHAEG